MAIYLGFEDALRQLLGNRNEWRFSKKHLSDGTTPRDITSDKVRPGRKRTIQFVSVESDAPADMTFRIGYIDQLDEISWYTEQRGKQVAGVLYGMTGPVVLQAGDRLLIRFTESEDGNNLSIYAEGFEQKVT